MAEKLTDDGYDIELEQVIAAMLSRNHALSAEDLEAFEALLDDPDLSDAQRREFLQTIWNLVVSVIDYAWHEHPVQQAMNDCGKLLESEDECTIEGPNMVCSQNRKLSEQYGKAADEKRRSGGSA